MTENEALKLMESLVIDTKCELVKTLDFKETVIRALEDLQQYRAIGTVEGYERAIQSSIENYNLYREYKAKVQEYEAIGTVEEFKALKEKDEPKRLLTREEKYPQNYGVYSTEDRWCPSCKSLVFDGNWSISKQIIMYKRKRCSCGQILNWE